MLRERNSRNNIPVSRSKQEVGHQKEMKVTGEENNTAAERRSPIEISWKYQEVKGFT